MAVSPVNPQLILSMLEADSTRDCRFTTLVLLDTLRLTPQLELPRKTILGDVVIPDGWYEAVVEVILWKGGLLDLELAAILQSPWRVKGAENVLKKAHHELADEAKHSRRNAIRYLPEIVLVEVSNKIYAHYGIEGRSLDFEYLFTTPLQSRIGRLGVELRKITNGRSVCSILKVLDLFNTTDRFLKATYQRREKAKVLKQ